MHKKADTTLAPILTAPTHWSREQLPPLQLKKEVCTWVTLIWWLKLLTPTPSSSSLLSIPHSNCAHSTHVFLHCGGVYMHPHRHAGTGSVGELSQNSLRLVLKYGSTQFGTLSQPFGYYFGQRSLLLLLWQHRYWPGWEIQRLTPGSSDTVRSYWIHLQQVVER